ncbi:MULTISPECIES: hypothetical protein [unclassified Thalassospira]|uniref:hypothetical protein n=1 Tax=unclassified Thalassospira TaxID=2648997 RepID=UPI000C482CFD|nr:MULTISPECIES: hypothetical protein [unclassified Thalassospira]MBC05682.1 hypothetical protein [Thalassospira sp.]|tara:strand:- start:2473 stop:3069 length:597 start_codon:yes stop_codon:yes gene_type:complete
MNEKILYSSPEAAERKEVTGWVSADGRFYGDNEHLARWAGCTHILCRECGKHEHEKSWTCCETCRDKHVIERYNAKPFKAWDGERLFSYSHERYFFDEQELIDFALEHNVLPGEMRLAICEPDILKMVDFDDILVDRLPEDLYLSDIAPELAEAVAKVNDIIQQTKPVLAWNPGKYRTTVTAAALIAAKTANRKDTAA